MDETLEKLKQLKKKYEKSNSGQLDVLALDLVTKLIEILIAEKENPNG